MWNTGVGVAQAKKVTGDGFELVFGTNHFGHFLLTTLLIDKLKECVPSRVITVASGAEKFVKTLDLSATARNGVKYPDLNSYGKSKAANIMFARELARRLKGTGVTSYSVEPGVAYTNIASNILGGTIATLMAPLLW